MNRPRDPLPLHRLEVPAPRTLPFAIGSFDRVGPLARAGFPHRHTFYEIDFITGGRGAHRVDLAEWPLDPPHLCCLVPGQVHSWERASDLSGWVILFTDDFLVTYPGDRDVLRELGHCPWRHLTPDIAPGFASLVCDMEREFDARGDGFVTVLQAYLHVLLVRASRVPGAEVASTVTGAPVQVTAAHSTVARRFDRVLAEPGGSQRSVRDCAARLGVSVSYLNEAVKGATGRTPGKLIRQAQALEAKRLLAGSGLTVRQVARQVGFADPAYFCRFFRREIGTTPGDFRRQEESEPAGTARGGS